LVHMGMKDVVGIEWGWRCEGGKDASLPISLTVVAVTAFLDIRVPKQKKRSSRNPFGSR